MQYVYVIPITNHGADLGIHMPYFLESNMNHILINSINYRNDTIGSPTFEAPCMIIPSQTISSHLCMQTSRILAIHLLQKYI